MYNRHPAIEACCQTFVYSNDMELITAVQYIETDRWMHLFNELSAHEYPSTLKGSTTQLISPTYVYFTLEVKIGPTHIK